MTNIDWNYVEADATTPLTQVQERFLQENASVAHNPTVAFRRYCEANPGALECRIDEV